MVGFIWLVTLIALLLVAQTSIRSLQWGYEYPLMSLREPTRALFEFAEEERRVIQSGQVPSWWMVRGECAACNVASLQKRWAELFEEHRAYVAAGYKRHRGRRWLEELEAAREISLAAWGDAGHRAALEKLRLGLPEYLDDRRAELLRGDTLQEQARIERAGQRLIRQEYVKLAFVVFALGAVVAYQRGYRYPRRPQRSRLAALELGHGLLVFVWAKGFVCVLTILRWDNPEGVLAIFYTLPSLGPTLAIAALLVGTRVDRASTPIKDLLRCPPDRRSRRTLWVAALTSIGLVYAFDWVAWSVLHFAGLVNWYDSLRDHAADPTSLSALLAAFSAVVLAPFAEELTYRGVLFGSLATRMSTHRAALISCLVFAGFHGYGLYGFASVALSGYLWARLAARTGTLVPGMLAHALVNAVIEIFRALLG